MQLRNKLIMADIKINLYGDGNASEKITDILANTKPKLLRDLITSIKFIKFCNKLYYFFFIDRVY